MYVIFNLRVTFWRFFAVSMANMTLALLLMYFSLVFLTLNMHLDIIFLICCLSYIITAHLCFFEGLAPKLMLITAIYLLEGILSLSLHLLLPKGYGFFASIQTQIIITALIFLALSRKQQINRTLNIIPQRTLIPYILYALFALITLQIQRRRIIALDLLFAYFILLLSAILLIFMIIALYQSALSSITKNEKETLSTLEEAERRSYKLLLSSIEALRIRNHDARHHIRTIKGFLQYGKKDEALKYLEILEEENGKSQQLITCLNPAVDAILKYYIELCKANQIEFEHHFTISESLGNILDTDLCSSLSNMLENAINAVSPLSKDLKKIRAIAFERRSNLIIKVENSVQSPARPIKYGTGTLSLTHLATKYNGTFTTEQTDSQFSASLILSLA